MVSVEGRGVSADVRDVFDLPEGHIWSGGIAIGSYMDADGRMKFGYSYDTSGLPLSSTIGLLEIAKLDLYGESARRDDD